MQIKDVVALADISAYTIRFYEKKGLVQVKRDVNGVRVFDEKTINRIRWIQCYRRAGLSIKEINQIIEADLSLSDFLAMLDDAQARLDAEVANLKFTAACLALKKHAALAGEPLTDVTACAPTPYDEDQHYHFGGA